MIHEGDLLLTKGQSQSLVLWVNWFIYSKLSVLEVTVIFLISLHEACEFPTNIHAKIYIFFVALRLCSFHCIHGFFFSDMFEQR